VQQHDHLAVGWAGVDDRDPQRGAVAGVDG
jgi:hypothetical protein